MKKDISVVTKKPFSISKWRIIMLVNLLLGAGLWLGYISDYSLAGTLPDILVPPIIGIVTLSTLFFIQHAPNNFAKVSYIVSIVPSFVGGCLPTLLMLLLLFSPLGMGVMFFLGEIGDETLIQQSISPDGSKVAEVYFRGVGAYSGGNGRIIVRVKPRRFPLIEQDVYYLTKSYADKDTKDYLHWIDNNTLFISETKESIHLKRIGFAIPAFLLVLLIPIFFFISVA